jgi:hypothetical protein
LDLLAKVSRVQFDINEKAFAGDENDLPDLRKVEIARQPIPAIKSSMRTVLKKILARIPTSSRAIFLIRKDHIEITTEKAVVQELGLSKTEPLLPLVWEDFRKVSLESAFNTLADASDFNIIIDARVEEKTALKISARLANVPVDVAVRLLADMAGLSVVRMGNVFYVTSSQSAEKWQKKKG